MSIKPRRQVFARGDKRGVVHAGLLIICAMLSILGMGVTALWAFLPAAVLLEVLARFSPVRHARRM
ncbi:hypothetical protein EY643_05210 [Halioglobus maricola]|uniref:Uncharacterized protein n=1 Tax=Halioglobus maricola TaxID=2601894 RepID=A0A5P9NGZ9_9GAMM|nr:hypothetical protein [Halioglobus maricola]QFU75093.1 hypothetical protein EY643_05210 [Halioglobus maricola]